MIDDISGGTGNRFRSECFEDRADGRCLRGVDIDTQQAPWRRAAGIDPPARGKASPTRVGNRQTIDLQACAVDLDAGADVTRLNADERGASDISRRQAPSPRAASIADPANMARPKSQRRIDVELRRCKLRIEPGGLVACREPVGEPPGGGLAIEFDLELLD